MKAEAHICVLYGKGRAYRDVLRAVKAAHPQARICALVPAGYVMSAEERALAIEVAIADTTRYSRRDIRSLARLRRRLRAARYDAFVIAFDTPRQAIFAALSGARQVLYCRMDGSIVRIHGSVPGILAMVALRRIWGGLAYAGMWVMVHARRVHPH